MQEWSHLLVACLMACSCRAAAYSRIMTLGGKSRGPSMFRPGASMLRPAWAGPQRFMQAASNRAPYVLYKNPGGNRYMKPHFSNKFGGYVAGPWRTAVRVPTSSPVYEFVRAASGANTPHRPDGPIYTMPAPNLSLADKPIVVVDMQEPFTADPTNRTKMYEVTEKTLDPASHGVRPQFIASPSGPQGFTFSKAPSLSSPELLQLVRSSPQQFQLSDTYPLPILQQPHLLRHTALGPQLTLQGFNTIMQPPTDTDPSLLHQNILFKPDPAYIHKISNQLYHRFPGTEFLPYPIESNQSPVYIIADEDKNEDREHFNVARGTEEGTVLSLVLDHVVPNATTQSTVTQTIVNATSKPDIITVPVLNMTQLEGTTPNMEATTEVTEKQTPIYYPQIADSVGSIITNGFYSALSDVRAAEALALVNDSESEKEMQNATEVSITADLKPYFIENNIKVEENETDVLKPHKGSPFTKAEASNVAYSFLRRDEEADSKVQKDGVRLAGQIVEASISDDDFIHDRAALRQRRPPLRLYTNYESSSEKPKKIEAKSKPKPPRSKISFDEVTGEPVIRIYASYESSNNSSQERGPSRSKHQHHKAEPTRGTLKLRNSSPNTYEDWKSSSVKALDRIPSGSDINQVTQFGLKLRPRMDDFTSIFEDEE